MRVDFWRLLSRLLLQKDVREQFVKSKQGSINSDQVMYTNWTNTFLILLNKMITEYFTRKKERRPADYDPELEMNMFIYTIEGFARITMYQDDVDEENYLKTINKIIEQYK